MLARLRGGYRTVNDVLSASEIKYTLKKDRKPTEKELNKARSEQRLKEIYELRKSMQK